MNCQNGFSGKDSVVAKRIMQKKLQGSRLLTCENLHPIPCFHISELTLGKILGHGQFCNVYEIKNIDERQFDIANYDIKNDFHDIFGETKKMESKSETNQNGEGQEYVIKCLKPEIKSMKTHFTQGLFDLAFETKILSALRHPNIIEICGFAKQAMFHHDYFIVLEKLDCTLQEKFDLWRDQHDNRSFLRKMLNRKNNKIKRAASFRYKLGVFREISSALSYLHSHRIIHRDLKPSNIGFCSRGKVKLFDFGLATEMKDEKRNNNGLYRLSGNTGTKRYMAPEIARKEPYNESVDIYSFGILSWEMIANAKPFEEYTSNMFKVLVATMGDRPKIDDSFPDSMSLIITRCWSQNCKKRPDAFELHELMEHAVNDLPRQ